MTGFLHGILRTTVEHRAQVEAGLILAGVETFEERDEMIDPRLTGYVEFHLYGEITDEFVLTQQVHASNVRKWLVSEPEFQHEAAVDWSEAWKVHYQPLRLSPRVTVVPSWIHYQPNHDERVIILDPGTAFGTGQHDTTALCVQALDLKSAESEIGRCADVGTGTGILALAAHYLGATELWLTENDPLALAVARDNLKDITADFVLCEQPKTERRFETVIANILAEPLVGMAADLAALLSPKGTLFLSGLLSSQAQTVEQAFLALGLRTVRQWNQGEWSLLWMVKSDDDVS
tara:strand:+ start:2313 stop:3185 length:873 start_codon:yes stop_codon:yes gene_type:complete